ncbi:MAG: helix-turn-helix transcriptional regulator [Acidimicrobiia bacterium]
MSSARTARRLSRILSVLPFIIENEGAEIADLVDRFGYKDQAELVKDLHLVFVTGLPGYGPGDLIDVDIFADEVFVDAADYFSRPLQLTPAEALGLLAAGTTLLASDQAPEHLASAVDKLVALIGEDTARAVSFDVPTPELVPVLRAAIESRRVVRIAYVGIATNERTLRDVEGWAVSFSRGNWYLTGHCRLAGARRVFRIDHIEACEELDDTYELPILGSDESIGYRPSDDDVSVSFTVDASSSWVAEYYPVDSTVAPDGSVRITMSVSDPLTAARLLVQLGDTVTDVEGDEVLAARAVLVDRIRTRYARTE